jgi:hypothetical protein
LAFFTENAANRGGRETRMKAEGQRLQEEGKGRILFCAFYAFSRQSHRLPLRRQAPANDRHLRWITLDNAE